MFPALLLACRWKALSAAVATSLLLILISVAVFGYQLWFTYFQAMALPMREVAMGSAPWRIMPTFFVAVRAAGGGVTAAYLVQGLVMLAVAAGVAWVWRQPAAPLASRGTVLIWASSCLLPMNSTTTWSSWPWPWAGSGRKADVGAAYRGTAPAACRLAVAGGRSHLVYLDQSPLIGTYRSVP